MNILINKNQETLSGVYQIRNLISNKVYIGSTVEFKRRISHHIYTLIKGIHHSRHLQRSFNKYGSENFEFSIVEICIDENILEREQYWLNEKQSYKRDFGYNVLQNSHNSLGYKHTEETLILIKEIAQKRKPHINTLEALWKSSRGKKRSPEHIEKMIKARIQPVIQLDLSGSFIKEWDSISEVNLFLGLKKGNSNISKCCKDGKSLKGFLWRKKEDYDVNENYSYRDKRFKNKI